MKVLFKGFIFFWYTHTQNTVSCYMLIKIMSAFRWQKQAHSLPFNTKQRWKQIKRVCCIDCPRGFHYIASVHGCYKLQTRRLTWDQAARNCPRLHRNAHLIIINNAAEQSAVQPWINYFSSRHPFLLYSLSNAFAALQNLAITTSLSDLVL